MRLLFALLTLGVLTAEARVIPVQPTAKTAARKPANEAPFQASEELDYLAKAPENFLGFGRPPEFKDVVTRPYAGKTDLAQVYLYDYGLKSAELNTGSCEKIAQRMFGRFDEISLRKTASETFAAKSGPACHVVLQDPDQDTLTRERHVFVATIGRRVYALLFQFRAGASRAEIQNMRDFIKDLKDRGD